MASLSEFKTGPDFIKNKKSRPDQKPYLIHNPINLVKTYYFF
jgi:hypothetical protein